MEASSRFVVLNFLVVILLVSVSTESSNQSAFAAQISSTHTASCLVKITFDPLVLSLDGITIDSLLHSTSISGKVARTVLDISPDQAEGIFTVETLGQPAGSLLLEPSSIQRSGTVGMMESRRMGQEFAANSTRTGSSNRMSTNPSLISPAVERTILFKLQVDLPQNVKPAAEEFMYALVNTLRSTLVKVFEDYKLRFENQLKLAQQEATNTESDLREKQKALREISRTRILDRQQILADIYSLRQEEKNAKANQAKNRVIINATTQRISEIETKITEQLENDAVAIELQKIIDLLGRLLIETEKEAKANRIPASQVDAVRERLARTRIEKAKHREAISKSYGGNLIASLNKELADRSIQVTEQEASLVSLAKQIAEAESLLAKADDYELLTLKVEMTKQSLQESILWRDRLSRQIRLLQSPTVSIFGDN
jgi:hypothetical protein